MRLSNAYERNNSSLYDGAAATLSTSTLDAFSTSGVPPTTVAPESIPQYLGFIACGVAVLFFGSNFIPVKQFKTGDGFFFQWLLCSAIFLVGVIVNAAKSFPKFYPLAMIGGWCWATGNVLTVLIIQTIGLSQGLLIWGMFNCLMGWASGTFGWFGLPAEKENINNKPMNYAGVAIAVSSAFVYMFVKSNVSGATVNARAEEEANGSTADLVSPTNVQNKRRDILTFRRTPRQPALVDVIEKDQGTASFVDKLPQTAKRIIGIGGSMIAGTLYGVNFIPVLYIMAHTEGASQDGLDYVFAHFTGIFLTGTLYFLIYCIFKKNKPDVYPRIILPGFVSGAMWAVAQTSWFIANQALSQSISFPIITSGPSIVAAVIGIIIYKEIQGLKNYIILAVVFIMAVTGSVLVAFSKIG